MRDHELRRQAVGEMHLRRWPVLSVPCQIVQWVITVDRADRAEELAMIERHARLGITDNPQHREGGLGARIRFSWERQSEGSTLALFVADATEAEFLDPTSNPDLAAAIDWARALPGRIVRATRLWLGPDDAAVERLLPQLSLNRDELVSSRIGERMRLWSDFRIKEEGFGQLLVAANGADPRDITRQIQRLQELGNYRNIALLGLPVARECWPKLDAAEARLNDIAARIGTNTLRDDNLLEEISTLALDLATVAAATSFRLDATRAYGQIVEERLEQIDCRPVEGFASLVDFTQRRFRPAMNTCAATSERISRLCLRTEQLTSLLRARIDTRIESQNAELLQSMNRSLTVQAQLQQLVEGLSTVALSYYLLSLVKLALYAVPDAVFGGLTDNFVVGVLVVPVVLTVWMAMRALKRRLLGDGGRG